MEGYLQDFRTTAATLGEDVDRITLEPLSIVGGDNSRHETIPLTAEGCIQFWAINSLHGWININPTHPITRRKLEQPELDYIEHYFMCYTLEQQDTLDVNELYDKYVRGGYNDDDKLKIRCVLSPKQFADHFKDYEPLQDDIQYERTKATAELNQSLPGSWLLRHSSYNRTINAADQNLIKKLGLTFYALSCATVSGIKHRLFLHRPGWGWCVINTVQYTETTVNPLLNKGTVQWFVCFADLLTALLTSSDLLLKNRISGYIN